jgi:tetratricopeptide (TPR) repeat protein
MEPAPSAEEVYSFANALLREAAYQTQLPSLRARLHALAIEAIESSGFADDITAEALADHCRGAIQGLTTGDDAGMSQRASLAVREIGYLQRAARHAAATYRNDHALRLFDRICGHTGVGAPDRANAMAESAEIASNVGRFDDARRRFAEARDLARECGDRSCETRSVRGIGLALVYTGKAADAEPMLSAAMLLARHTGDRQLLGQTLSRYAILLKMLGRMTDAEATFGEALAIGESLGEKRLEAVAIGNLAGIYNDLRRHDDALSAFRRALTIFHEIGDLRSEAITVGNLGNLFFTSGHPAQAIRCYTRALEIHRAVSNRRDEGITLANLAVLHRDIGRIDDAIALVRSSLAIHDEVQNVASVGTQAGTLGQLHLLCGDIATARIEAERASTLLSGARSSAMLVRNGMSLRVRLSVEAGRLGEAWSRLGEMAEACRAQAAPPESEPARALAGADQLVAEAGRPDPLIVRGHLPSALAPALRLALAERMHQRGESDAERVLRHVARRRALLQGTSGMPVPRAT